MTRKQALTYVTAGVAEIGRVDTHTLRIYVENRISKKSFNEAVALGVRVYVKNHPDQAQDEGWLTGTNQLT